MSYHQDNLKKLEKIKFFSLFVMVGVVFYFFSNFILAKGFDILSSITVPLWKLEDRFRGDLNMISSLFRSKESLQIENEKLAAELDDAKLELDSLDALKQENKELMVQMGREIPEASKSVIAAVLSGPNVPPYESLIIDVGKESGVSVGDRVVYGPNIILGEIIRIYNRSSRVKLYSAYGVQTDVLIPSDKAWHAVATGFGGGNFSIDLPITIPVVRGLKILIPRSDIYILGIVDYIKIDSITSSQRILIKYPINIKKIRFVHVIKVSGNEYLE